MKRADTLTLAATAPNMTLEQLIWAIEGRLAGRKCTMSWLDRSDGSQVGAAKADGKLFATWEAELVNAPVFDGKTPRGPKCYHSLRFFDCAAGNN